MVEVERRYRRHRVDPVLLHQHEVVVIEQRADEHGVDGRLRTRERLGQAGDVVRQCVERARAAWLAARSCARERDHHCDGGRRGDQTSTHAHESPGSVARSKLAETGAHRPPQAVCPGSDQGLRRVRDDGGDGGRLERVDEAPYGDVGPGEIELAVAERVAERLVPEVGPVERREPRAKREIDIEPWIGETQRCLVLDDDPIAVRIIAEVDVDDEASPGQRAGRRGGDGATTAGDRRPARRGRVRRTPISPPIPPARRRPVAGRDRRA